jgi:type I pantothenate kinase
VGEVGDVDVDVAALALERGAGVVGITGGVGAGKSTYAAALATRLPAAVVVGTDGFLFPNAVLDARGLTARKNYPESFDAAALQAFLVDVRADRPAAAPVYSHLTYDVLPGISVVVEGGGPLVLEGLHLGHPDLGVRDGIDLLVHLDAADEDMERWFLRRFQGLRAEAAADPTAFLHGLTQVMSAEELDAMALGVWEAVNLVLLHEVVRPAAAAADVVLHFGPAHEVVRAEVRL